LKQWKNGISEGETSYLKAVNLSNMQKRQLPKLPQQQGDSVGEQSPDRTLFTTETGLFVTEVSSGNT